MNDRLERKRLRHVRAQREILDAAERALSGRHVSELTMEDIASEASYSPGALYGYYPGKEALVAALFERLREELREALQAQPPDSLSFEKRLAWRMAKMAGVVERHIGLAYAYHVQGYVPREQSHDTVDLHNDIVTAFVDIVEHGIAEGMLRGPNALDLALALIGAQREFLFHWLRMGRQGNLEARLLRVAELFLDGARRERGADSHGEDR